MSGNPPLTHSRSANRKPSNSEDSRLWRDQRGEGKRNENEHKLQSQRDSNVDCYWMMTRPVEYLTKRSYYNSKPQRTTPPNLGGSEIAKISTDGGSFAKTNCTSRTPNSYSTPHAWHCDGLIEYKTSNVCRLKQRMSPTFVQGFSWNKTFWHFSTRCWNTP